MDFRKVMFIAVALLSATVAISAKQITSWPTIFTGIGPTSNWWLYGMDHGGVAEDIQVIYPCSGSQGSGAADVVWTACMNGGYYRSVWDENAESWGNWDMNLPAKKGYGLDVIRINEGGSAKECVLVASQGLGLRYAEDNQYGFDPDWSWPNTYPSSGAWRHAGTHDAAFYLPQYDTSPEDSFYVILSGVEGFNPGIYRWDNDPEVLDFVRVDVGPGNPAHHYHHFYRDAATPNVLYVIREAIPEGESGELYILSGAYGHMSDPVEFPVDPEEVLGFSQWKAPGTGTMTYYALLKISDTRYVVYVTTGSMDNPNWQNIYEDDDGRFLRDSRDWSDIYQFYYGAGVIGRPLGNNHHDLWMTTPMYGVWYLKFSDLNLSLDN